MFNISRTNNPRMNNLVETLKKGIRMKTSPTPSSPSANSAWECATPPPKRGLVPPPLSSLVWTGPERELATSAADRWTNPPHLKVPNNDFSFSSDDSCSLSIPHPLNR